MKSGTEVAAHQAGVASEVIETTGKLYTPPDTIQSARETWLDDGAATGHRHGAPARIDEEVTVADFVGDRPDPQRQHLLASTRFRSPVDAVVDAIAVYTEYPGHVYVERFDDGWRWSPAHRGGAYPLLRVTARFLRVDHFRVIVPFRAVGHGWCVLMPDGDDLVFDPAAWTVLSFEGPTPRAVVAQDIERELAA